MPNLYLILLYSQVTHEIPTRKKFGPTKYPREKNLDARNTEEKEFRTHKGTMVQEPRNLAHCFL